MPEDFNKYNQICEPYLFNGLQAIAKTLKNLYVNDDGHIPYYNLVGNVKVSKDAANNSAIHGIESVYIDSLHLLCYKWFTGIKMLPFHYQMVSYVASHGNPNLFTEMSSQGNDKPVSLSDRLRLLYDGIAKAENVKAPKAALALQALHKIDGKFDPLAQTNMPCQWAVKNYFVTRTRAKSSRPPIFVQVFPVGPGTNGQVKIVQNM